MFHCVVRCVREKEKNVAQIAVFILSENWNIHISFTSFRLCHTFFHAYEIQMSFY